MKNRFIKAGPKDVIGSGFVGYLQGSYSDLVKCFGRPNDRTRDGKWRSGDGKVRAEWAFKTTARRRRAVITIYDYKENQPVQSVTNWHVGLKGAAYRLEDFFKERKTRLLNEPAVCSYLPWKMTSKR